ncbi:hypothetical protein ACHAXM_006946 [Skeletonema potamos]
MMSSSSTSDDKEYEIEKVINHRRNTFTGFNEYLIKWKNYPSSENSWEPESNLNSSALEEARRKFLQQTTTNTKKKTKRHPPLFAGRLVAATTPSSRNNDDDDDDEHYYHYYDTLAPTINLHDITSSRQNRRILQRLIQNDVTLTQLFIVEEHDEENRRYDGLNSGNNFIPSVISILPSSSTTTTLSSSSRSGRRRRGATTTTSSRRRNNNNNSCDTTNNNTTKADDMGWLGHFIGKSHTLQNLHIGSLLKGEQHIEPFWTGIQHNRSISSLRFGGCDLLLNTNGRNILDKLQFFFRYNGKLTKIEFTECTLGNAGAKSLSIALQECTNKGSLKCVRLDDNDLTDRGLKLIIRALSLHKNLEGLTISDNNVGREGCRELGRYITSSSKWRNKLKDLNLSYNRIDDEALSLLLLVEEEGLGGSTITTAIDDDDDDTTTNTNYDEEEEVPNYCALKQLCLTGNSDITYEGLRTVTSSLLSKPYCNLEQLWLYHMTIGDEGASVLAEGLVTNTSLRKLWFNPATCGITSHGWNKFNQVLCDTSTINNTYLSNHTLALIGKHYTNFTPSGDQIPNAIRKSLRLHNYIQLSTKEIAHCKIMKHHKNMRMDPFFEWKLKMLPVVVSWFANVRKLWDGPETQRMELSSIFQFVRGLPFFFGSESGLAVRAREVMMIMMEEDGEEAARLVLRKRNRGRYHPPSSFASSLGSSGRGGDRKKRRGGRLFAVGESVVVKLDGIFTDVAVVKSVVSHEGWKPVYQVQFANGEIRGGVGADALSEVIEVTSL